MKQLSLFEEPAPAPEPAGAPVAFFWAGWMVRRADRPFGGRTNPSAPGRTFGWESWRFGEDPDDPATSMTGGYSAASIRQMRETGARVAGLPMDLWAKGWRRDERPEYAHWLHWPGNGVSCCRWPTLEQNIETARTMRPMSELRARAEAAYQAEQQPKKKTRKAA